MKLATLNIKLCLTSSYLSCSVHGSKSVGVDTLAHGKLVGDLEERSHAEDLCQVRSDSSEHIVVEEDIPLNLFGKTLDSARVGKAELGPPLVEGVEDISEGATEGIRKKSRLDGTQCGGHCD
jgi:hypothetical protein